MKVDDDDECAEAGDIYERNNSEYFRVGDTVYRKDLFGWTKLTSDDDEYVESSSSSSVSSSSYNYDDYDDSYSSSDDTSSSTTDSTSNGGSLLNGVIVIVIIIAVILYLLNNRSGTNTTPAYQAPAVSVAPTLQAEQQAATNPYGQGNGQISFYRTCTFCKVEVLKDTFRRVCYPPPVCWFTPNAPTPIYCRQFIPWVTILLTSEMMKAIHGSSPCK